MHAVWTISILLYYPLKVYFPSIESTLIDYVLPYLRSVQCGALFAWWNMPGR